MTASWRIPPVSYTHLDVYKRQEYTIDVFRELAEAIEDEDIYLDEFRDEIDGWVIDAIKAIGIDTAKAVLLSLIHIRCV